jgi:hypothetical protein
MLSPESSLDPNARRYGLDWLRIGAFGLLIFYHIGMFFVPWGWHIKTAHPVEWLTLPMLGLNAWRLPLLFAISGVASRFLIGKDGAAENRSASFARSRTARLLPALLFGVAVIVAPQAWVDITVNHGYDRPFGWFWRHDYFDFSTRLGIALPTWNHLWFVVYLLAYSWIAALVLALPASVHVALQRGFDRLLAGGRVFWVPALWILVVNLLLDKRFPETHALVDDWHAHLIYGSCFAFGLGVAKSATLWTGLRAHWRRHAALAFGGYGFVVIANLVWPGDTAAPSLANLAYGVARVIQGWGAIVALFGFADSHWHHDSPARRYLTDAVFPYYIIHQTIIVVVAFALRPYGLGNAASFALLLGATIIGCALFYELARRSGRLRPLFGLAPARSIGDATARLAPAAPGR